MIDWRVRSQSVMSLDEDDIVLEFTWILLKILLFVIVVWRWAIVGGGGSLTSWRFYRNLVPVLAIGLMDFRGGAAFRRRGV